MSLNKLPPATIKRLYSSEVISSVFCAIKELVENALDSGATSIDVKLVNFGLDSIEVQDNGVGVPSSYVKVMCLPHYTSKISDFSDLGTSLETYGFRGEALSSLCNVSNVTVITRTTDDEYASCYCFDASGQVTEVKPSHFGKGTTVVANNIFSNLPVRKRYMSSSYKLKTELKKIETLVKNLAIINYKIGFTFWHNKDVKWQKSPCTTLKESVSSVMGYTFGSQMEEVSADLTKNSITLLLPKQNCNSIASLCLPEGEAVRIFINQRTVENKKFKKVIFKCFSEHWRGSFVLGKYPFCVVNIQLPPNYVDVNTEPNKTKLLCHNEDELIAAIERIIPSFYGSSNQQEFTDEFCTSSDEKLTVHKNQNERCSPNLITNNVSCLNDNTESDKLSDDAMVLWSRGHIGNPDNGHIVQGGATLYKRRAEHVEELIDDSCQPNKVAVLEPKRKCNDVGSALKKMSSYFTTDTSGVNQNPSVSNINDHLINKKMGLSSCVPKKISKIAAPIPSNLQNYTISEIFKKSAPDTNLHKEGEVKKPLTWYKPSEKKSLEIAVKKWNIVVDDWNICSNVNGRYNVTTHSDPEIQLVHQLPNGIWMYKCGPNIGTVRHWCIKENLYYEQYLKSCGVPVTKLQKPILILRKYFTPEQWQHLLTMKIEDECTDSEMNISNDVITKNGLKLAWINGEMFITHVASSINFNGIEELKEILSSLNAATDLSQCRPAKVKAFFKSEAVRSSRRKEIIAQEEMLKLLTYCKDTNLYCHGKPIFDSLHTFSY